MYNRTSDIPFAGWKEKSSARLSQKSLKIHTHEENVVVAVEGHEHTSGLVDGDGLEVRQRTRIPYAKLATAHLAEPCRRDPILVAHPHHTRALDPCVALSNAHRLPSSTGVKQADFAVSAGGDEEVAVEVEREALDGIRVARQHALGVLGRGEIPELDVMLARRARQNVLRGRVGRAPGRRAVREAPMRRTGSKSLGTHFSWPQLSNE